MKNQSMDTHPETEREMISLIRCVKGDSEK